MLISGCFFHAYTSLEYGVHASKKTCANKQAFISTQISMEFIKLNFLYALGFLLLSIIINKNK